MQRHEGLRRILRRSGRPANNSAKPIFYVILNASTWLNFSKATIVSPDAASSLRSGSILNALLLF